MKETILVWFKRILFLAVILGSLYIGWDQQELLGVGLMALC